MLDLNSPKHHRKARFMISNSYFKILVVNYVISVCFNTLAECNDATAQTLHFTADH